MAIDNIVDEVVVVTDVANEAVIINVVGVTVITVVTGRDRKHTIDKCLVNAADIDDESVNDPIFVNADCF
ncbi:hypothetical protein NDU88_010101 [Pleurodeles waltl]|uniref:Uncharacterized protein n=1 Tax=Pleurodeles waltl TaxID=8319 RepID=A0AAV7PU71_PLEWA|nr:hypothetical protein NDU88_010101 [Pleurodeles waltl]